MRENSTKGRLDRHYDQDFISLGPSVSQARKNKCLSCTGPKKRHGTIPLALLFGETALPSCGRYYNQLHKCEFSDLKDSCRYLTKICDQIVSLVSSQHAESIVWDEDKDDNFSMDADDEDESDRLFTFEVTKTKEQEENVSTRPGFQVRSILLWRYLRLKLTVLPDELKQD